MGKEKEFVTTQKCLETQWCVSSSQFHIRKKVNKAIVIGAINGIANIILAIAYFIR